MMVGPSGTGKTELVLLACKKLGLECNVYDMGSMYDPVSGLLGVHRLQKGGESVFDYAKFTQDIQKPGVILLDELSRAPVTTNNILFPCLDSRRMLPVEMAGGEDLRSIQVHPDCVFVATANVGAEYTGTMSLDRALVGRFFPLELDYMPLDCEVKVLSKRCGIRQEDAENIASVAGTVRSLYGKQEISCTISTRETLAAARLVADGWTSLEAMELTFLPLFEGTRTEGERGVIAKIFMTR
jgi:nitric oxide reductase NorQ protein